MIGRHKLIIIVVAAVLFVAILAGGYLLFRRRKYNSAHFQRRWDELQKLCADKKNWPAAIIDADKLLDEALKSKHFRGKSTGERLVSAQHALSNNDTVWFGHKLRTKIDQKPSLQLGKKQVRQALLGFLKALKDLNVL
jgi:hypothetical protein